MISWTSSMRDIIEKFWFQYSLVGLPGDRNILQQINIAKLILTTYTNIILKLFFSYS